MTRRRGSFVKALLYILAFISILVALQQLWHIEGAIQRTRTSLGGIPVEVFMPRDLDSPQPAAVIAHGFAASRQYMYPFAYALAQNGYVAAVFDFSGHGKNASSFPHVWHNVHHDASPLTQDLRAVIGHTRSLPQVDAGQIALIGYSMGSAVVTRYARDAGDIQATIAVSSIFSDVLPAQPRNLLLLTGGWEMESLKRVARDALQASGGGDVDMLNGDLGDGSARKLVFVPYVEHSTIPFSPRTLRETVAWLDGAFGRSSPLDVDRRLPWVGLLLAGSILLFSPFSKIALSWLVPHESGEEPSPLAITGFLLIILIPAVAAPLLLNMLPYRILPLAVGDYVVALLVLQGLALLALLTITGSLNGKGLWGLLGLRSVLIALISFAYLALTVGLVAEATLLSFLPVPRRAAIMGAAFLLILPYFLCTEYMTRTKYPGYPRFFPIISKIALLASLGGGALLGGPFVIVLFLPGMALLLLGSGLLSRQIYALTGQPGASGVFMALCFAWFMGGILPLT